MHSRLTAKERNLIKGALRRVFSCSDMRKAAIEKTVVDLSVVPVETREARPRVKTWCRCPDCNHFFAKSEMEADHTDPIVPTDRTLEDMDENELVARIWCDPNNLKGLCGDCHDAKTKIENKARAETRKLKKAALLKTTTHCDTVKKRKAWKPS